MEKASGSFSTRLLLAWMGCTISAFPSLCYPLIAQQYRADMRVTGMDYSHYITRDRAVEDDQPVPAVLVLA